jgi:hypothetical protein
MTPAEWDRFRQLPRDRILELLRAATPQIVSAGDVAFSCGEDCNPQGAVTAGGLRVMYRPPSWDEPAGALWYERVLLPVADYGPPGDSVYGDFRAGYYPSDDGSARLLTLDFFKGERSGSWFVENLDTIGPLAIRLFIMAATSGFLPLPYAPPVEAAGLIPAFVPPVEAAPMFDFFIPGEEVWTAAPDFFSVPDALAYVPGEEIWNASDLFPGDAYVPGEEVWTMPPPEPPPVAWEAVTPPGEEIWTPPGMDPVTPPTVAPPINPPPPTPISAPTVTLASDASIGDIIQSASGAVKSAIAALQTVRSLWQAIDSPQQRRPDGTVCTTLANGTISCRDAQGRVTTSRPPVGTLARANDGSLITNNGDGTYSRIDSAGRTQRLPYAVAGAGVGAGMGGSIGGIPTGVLLLGGAAVFLMMRRR